MKDIFKERAMCILCTFRAFEGERALKWYADATIFEYFWGTFGLGQAKKYHNGWSSTLQMVRNPS
jgi:hypothetical protein